MTTSSALLSDVVCCVKRQSPLGFQNSGQMLKVTAFPVLHTDSWNLSRVAMARRRELESYMQGSRELCPDQGCPLHGLLTYSLSHGL